MTRISRDVAGRMLSEAGEALDGIREASSMKLSEFLSSRQARFSLRYSIITL